MDGNGRWAKRRGLPANAGHRAGAQALKKLAPEVEKAGVQHLTVYAFSTENWARPPEEVEGLMRLLREYIQQYIDDAKKNEVRMSVIGDVSKMEPDLQRKIQELTEVTAHKQGLHVHIALNYGGRDEIVRAARHLARRVREEALAPDSIDEVFFEQCLDTAGIPSPELLIRTGSTMRLSNFMLWQVAYSEICVIDKLWPDFSPRDFHKALRWYQEVDRRFGGRV